MVVTMTYQEAKELLRDVSGLQNGRDLTQRLLASPGQLSEFDSSTAGKLPEGDALGDQILRSLLVVGRHLVGQKVMERDLAAILVELALPVRLLASDQQNAHTRIPQISLALDFVFHGFHGTNDA
jgi:hypothetical protein